MSELLLSGFTTIRAASKRLGVKPATLYMWMRNHGIPCQKIGSTIVVRESDLVGYTPRFSK